MDIQCSFSMKFGENNPVPKKKKKKKKKRGSSSVELTTFSPTSTQRANHQRSNGLLPSSSSALSSALGAPNISLPFIGTYWTHKNDLSSERRRRNVFYCIYIYIHFAAAAAAKPPSISLSLLPAAIFLYIFCRLKTQINFFIFFPLF